MEALNFLKFWRPNTIAFIPTAIPDPVMVIDDESDQEEEDDSFFDLEITSQDFDNKENVVSNTNYFHPEPKDITKNFKNQKQPFILQQMRSPNDFVSKRKILPVEPSSKPQSPIALLKSAPTFRAFRFKKQKQEKTESSKESKRSLSVKFKLDDEANVPKITRENSVRNRGNIFQKQKADRHALDDTSSSKRFSKDLVQKYLTLFKPLYDKVSLKKNNEKMKLFVEVSMATPASSPAKKQGKVSGKHKSQPVLPAGSLSPAVARRDDSLLQQLDGIQSAILHCKRSFNSSSNSSMDLSRKSAEEVRDELGI